MLLHHLPRKARLPPQASEHRTIIGSQIIQDIEFVLIEPLRDDPCPEGNERDN
jgi:hypothetical protein